MAREPLSEREKQLMERLLSHPLLFPSEFTGWIPRLVEKEALNIPDSSILRVTDTWHYVGDAGEPAFANGWVNLDAGSTRKAAFTKRDGIVYLRGAVKSGTVGSAIFTLPAAYRHDQGSTAAYPVVSNGAFGQMNVQSDGVVLLAAGSNTNAFFDGIVFPV